MANNRDVAREIRDEYVETMSKVLFSYFKAYSSRLAKLQFEEVATREDLMGLDDSVSMARAGGVTSLFSSKTAVKSKASVFTMGSRGQILEEDHLVAPIIVPHAQQQNESKVGKKVFFLASRIMTFSSLLFRSILLKSCFAANSSA